MQLLEQGEHLRKVHKRRDLIVILEEIKKGNHIKRCLSLGKRWLIRAYSLIIAHFNWIRVDII